MFNKVTHIA